MRVRACAHTHFKKTPGVGELCGVMWGDVMWGGVGWGDVGWGGVGWGEVR